jgi:uncharacterized protein (DUF1330 family)
MKVENQVRPTPDNFREFIGAADAPVVMVNLLKFREKAQYEDGRETNLSGREAYQLYAKEMRKRVEGAGGRFIFAGAVEGLLLGEVEEPWDAVGLVEYPSPKTLVAIASAPEFGEIEVHREAGLAGQLNITTREGELD